ncbi:ribosomal protein S18 acetylase RimI-like enzyme [Povalibacter uvarum]|uniref:Ribosomal protein S18 acetylase RimI-like enzyme n=1 Tax=Povalibacter uvarum TaxID=732238 RepID=A0A841HMY7_9GAMM|nr:GNAT family N-acetyltransferase [Povalibacter uvarum]MBB6093315.1 ribosomal protein S18 acetylase RimI-like enzyme [Povalibacter uvarum]
MQIRAATPADLGVLIELMRGYYRDDGLGFDAEESGAVMARLLNEPQWGRVWLGEVDGGAVGYVALCIGFSLELGGNDAFVDEVFVLPDHRGRGYGRQLVEFLIARAGELNIRALHLEVDQANTAAQQLYESLGFRKRDRYFLMTHLPDSHPLSPPIG